MTFPYRAMTELLLPSPAALPGRLRLPVIGSPMFLVSNPALVIAQCCAGVVGSFPALNARPQEALETWLTDIAEGLAAYRRQYPQALVAPYAVNLIVHQSNPRLEDDLATCVRHRVPIVITSLHAPDRVVEQVHAYGGIVLHDVTTLRHAKKAIGAGVDGLILVCAGAGGHAGALSPFALASEVRAIFDGLLVLAGAIGHGQGILAAQALGCDLAYMGTRFIASEESSAAPLHKQMIVDGTADDILYTPHFSGVPGNYLKPSIRAAGLDPDHLDKEDKQAMDFGKPRRWKDIWGSGQGIGAISAILPAAQIVEQLHEEYRLAGRRLGIPG
ncbi:NAD(P)H-dependent flavin oxidoreductase [Herbaspirillum sp. SJZ130]|uniref:NAD(P)H-dependent flavin oxidoreductase n=1 Tax=unclassified Herbaspirillum TaxID=2624150 RepID=UPI001174B095|nr:nitronate monooxygenase [Herbaspirillum sp. SJZ102]TQK09228.1 nitronate monooxygenase [Herbaspirillum sp. SJZ130]TQK14085.1 nitronate monooxygenase [Herbaspirillum sp. SJZ106]